MKGWIFGIAAAIWLFGTAGCGNVQEYLEITQEKGMSQEYLATLDRWTRSQIIYSQFDTRARIGATYRNSEFNRAYLAEYARIYQLREGERTAKEKVQSAAAADATEFIFYAYIPEKTSNDFDRRGSIWSIFLVTGNGERIDPLEIRRIDPITPVTTAFFPYINAHYGVSYLLRFPPLHKEVEAHDTMKLVFASVIAKVTLEFKTR